MEILERMEDPKRYFIIVIVISVVMVSNLERLEVPYPLLWVALLASVGIFSWFRFGNKPAAWIKEDSLYIWNGMSSAHIINKNDVVEIKYEKDSDTEHSIYAKLKVDAVQNILIHHKKEHVENDRLLNYINNNFMPVIVEIKTSNKALK